MKQRIDSVVAGIIRAFHIYMDVIIGGALTLVSAILFYLTFSIKIMKEPVSVVDTSRFTPQLVFGALMPIGIAMALMGLGKVKKNRETVPMGQVLEDSVLAFKRGVIALVSIAVFIALMEVLGFIPSAILYMIFSMFFMSAKNGWKPGAYIITSVLVAILCYILFRKFVYVRLPAGILKGVLG